MTVDVKKPTIEEAKPTGETKKIGNGGGGGGGSSVGVGSLVLYQPTPEQWPSGYHQHAAIVTGWDEDTQLANLLVFPDSVNYPIAKNEVKEGTDDGTFQQIGTDSKRTAQLKADKKQAEEAAKPQEAAKSEDKGHPPAAKHEAHGKGVY